MTPNTPELKAIVERLTKLERQNQTLRVVSMIALITLAAVVSMGQAVPTSHVVEAQKFVLKDANGNVRGWMGVVGNGSELTLGNSNAQPMLRLLVSTDASDLHFFGSRTSGINLGIDSAVPAFSIAGAEGHGRAGITFAKGGPSMSLQDENKFSTVIGTTELGTQAKGRSPSTSAASVVLFDGNDKVIWQAP
jgi:hypothetical protein